MIRETGSIQLSTSSGGPHFARTSKTIEKVKHKLNYQFGVWPWTTASAHRILKDNLKFCAYKMRIEPKLTEEHKNKRKKFVNWLGYNFRKEDTMRRRKNISSRRYVQLPKSTSTRDEADEKGGIKEKQKFPQKVMVWLGVCSKPVTPLVICHRETVDHVVYIQKVLLVALKYGNKTFGKHWTFEKDGANPHIHHLTQKWCQDNFPSFIDKDNWFRFKSIGLLYLG